MDNAAKVARQIEFYFSDANLRRDKFMQEKLKEHTDGFIPVSVFLTFNRLKTLTTEANVVADAIANESQFLKLNESRDAISRVTPFVDTAVSNDQVKACTAYLNRIPADATIESLKAYLSQFGDVTLVRIPKHKNESERGHRGFAFVEFTTPEAVAKLVAAIPRKPSTEATPEAEDNKPTEAEENKQTEAEESMSAEAEKESEAKPKPMYALTMAEWKEWSQTLRKGKKGSTGGAAATPDEPAKEDNVQREIGRLVRVTGNLEGVTKNDLKAIFSELGQVKYVDFYGDSKFATIRFASAEVAKQVVDKVAEGNVKIGENVLEASVLAAEEHEKYWAKVHAETAARAALPFNKKVGSRQGKHNKKRGREEVTDSALLKKAKAEEDVIAA